MARKILFPLFLVLALVLTSCAPAGQTAAQDDGTTHLVATTYPVYLFTSELVKGAEGITVDLMIDQPISCLHDYTLSVKDMKTLERADLIILSGAGLEETMEDALDTVSDTPQIDCAQGLALLESSHDHDHGHDHDDHDHEDTDHDEPRATTTRATPTSGSTPTAWSRCWTISPLACAASTRPTPPSMRPTAGWPRSS